MDDLYTVTQATEKLKIGRQAIFAAIKKKRLEAVKIENKWKLSEQAMKNYKDSLYKREFSKFNGRLLFDNQAGYFSLRQVAKMLNLPIQRLYYAVREGKLAYERRGCAYVVHMKGIVEFKESYLDIHIKAI